jgi:site-specific recombinase XerD
VQRAVKHARRKLGISVLPHELRHGYATHCLEYGTNPRAIQQVMGHKSLETTMGYLHAESLSVRSPLETLLTYSKTAANAPTCWNSTQVRI